MKGNNKITKLLENTTEAFYWIGFIMADGYIEEKRISLTLSSADIAQLQRLKEFLEVSNNIYQRNKYSGKEGKICSLVLCDAENVRKLKEKYNVGNRKTYNPPRLPVMTNDQFLAFMCGYIDGDGCISKQTGGTYTKKDGTVSVYVRNDVLLQVKCHKSWADSVERFGKRLCRIFDVDQSKSKIRIDKKGYLVWRVYGNYLLVPMKKRAIGLGIPLMKRKWDKVA